MSTVDDRLASKHWVLHTSLYYFFVKAHKMSTNSSTKSFFRESQWWLKNSSSCYTTTIDPQSKGMKVEEESNISQAIESNSSNCNFRDALIAAVIGLFHGIRFFTQRTMNLLLLSVYQVNPLWIQFICVVRIKNQERYIYSKRA